MSRARPTFHEAAQKVATVPRDHGDAQKVATVPRDNGDANARVETQTRDGNGHAVKTRDGNGRAVKALDGNAHAVNGAGKLAATAKVDNPATVGGERARTASRSLNDAAHKLGSTRPEPVQRPHETRSRLSAVDGEHDVVAHAGRLVLALGALGVVYGDIGTSPLYTEQFIFGNNRAAAVASAASVYGVVSLIFWSLMIVVTIKYAGIIMRAHNRGDGGIMALTALIQRRKIGKTALLVTIGIFGASLFFGDGMITPAISVLSAVEGLKVVAPGLSHLVVPISLGILAGLFAIQRRGTGAVGWMFGPVLLVWFAVLGILGAREVLAHPGVIQGLSPTWGLRFIFGHGADGFLILGGVVLAVTGAEALYADRGHFGAGPIRMSWLTIVFPALVLNYLGQAALIKADHAAIANPFLLLVPHWGRFPMVILATVATVIASQAVITGSFSVARQAVQLGFLPRLKIRHTSETEGQIYVPIINWMLAVGVIALVLGFGSAEKLGDIYGVAVTGTFILNTVLFLAIARGMWKEPRWKLVLLGSLLLTVEVSFFSANISKVANGAWLPLAIGGVISIVMVTWRRGREIVTRNRTEQEGSLEAFLGELARSAPPIKRVPGTAVFLSPGKETTPLALRAEVEHNHVLPEKVVIVSLDSVSVPKVAPSDRFSLEWLGRGRCKVAHVTIHVGYRDSVNVPGALALARKQGVLERNLDLEHASYFVSRIVIAPTDAPGMPLWRKDLFVMMARNAASPIDHFGLPAERTVSMGSQVPV
jgi:KUP system potassium uptake protein